MVLVLRSAEWHRDPGIEVLLYGWTAQESGSRPNPKKVSNPGDFAGFDLDTSLPLRPPLAVIDRYWLSPNEKQPTVRLAQPIVESRDLNSQPAGRICGRKPNRFVLRRLRAPSLSRGGCHRRPRCDTSSGRACPQRIWLAYHRDARHGAQVDGRARSHAASGRRLDATGIGNCAQSLPKVAATPWCS